MLLDPLTFRNGVRARNRAWLAPLTNMQSHENGSLGDDELRFLELRAQGGFGVVETCARMSRAMGKAGLASSASTTMNSCRGSSGLASAIRAAGALGLVQLFHGGLRSPSKLTGQAPWSASAVQEPGAELSREGTEADILGAIARFRDAAVRAHRAGFAGVELQRRARLSAVPVSECHGELAQ